MKINGWILFLLMVWTCIKIDIIFAETNKPPGPEKENAENFPEQKPALQKQSGTSKAGINNDTMNPEIKAVRDSLLSYMIDDCFPAWYGTRWSFNGMSKTPGQGEIACGYFVIHTLQQAGFKIPSKMAQQPSENIIKNLVGNQGIKRFYNNAPMEKIVDWIHDRGEGLYIVGLDIHVGYVIYYHNKITFCHSSYYNPPLAVVNQGIEEKSPLTDSQYRVIAQLFNEKMMKKWIKGEEFPLNYDYFKKNNVGGK